jgi:hypothetical protein
MTFGLSHQTLILRSDIEQKNKQLLKFDAFSKKKVELNNFEFLKPPKKDVEHRVINVFFEVVEEGLEKIGLGYFVYGDYSVELRIHCNQQIFDKLIFTKSMESSIDLYFVLYSEVDSDYQSGSNLKLTENSYEVQEWFINKKLN